MELFSKIVATVGLLGLVGVLVGFVGGIITDFETRFFERLFFGSIATLLSLVVVFMLAAIASIWFP